VWKIHSPQEKKTPLIETPFFRSAFFFCWFFKAGQKEKKRAETGGQAPRLSKSKIQLWMLKQGIKLSSRIKYLNSNARPTALFFSLLPKP
jgi:hypothetical protein